MAQVKKRWNKKELDEFKDLIIIKRNKAIKEVEESKKRTDDARNNNSVNAIYSSHMADASADHVEMEKAYYMLAREKKYLQYLDKAIRMIDDGTFGKCISCNELINKDRLEEVPHTQKCFDCKSNNN